jgi:hypothetical protein
MSSEVLELLTELDIAVRKFAAAYAPPRVPPGRYRTDRQFTERLTDALSSSQQFFIAPNETYSTWSMTAPLTVSHLAGSLIERIIDGVTPLKAAEDLASFLSESSSDIYVLMAVAGINLKETIEFECGVTAMPATSVPPTLAREMVFDLDRNGKNIFRGTILRTAKAQIALKISANMTVLHNSERDWEKHKVLTEDIVAKRDRALASLALRNRLRALRHS